MVPVMKACVVPAISVTFVLSISWLAGFGSSLFSWHPVLMLTGFLVLMPCGILFLSNTSRKSSRQFANRVKWHWLFNLGAAVCVFIGLIIIYVNKELHNKAHFSTWHSIFGIVSAALLLLQLICGACIKLPSLLNKAVSLRFIRYTHFLLALCTVSSSTVALNLAYFSKWFGSFESDALLYASMSCTLIPVTIIITDIIKKLNAHA